MISAWDLKPGMKFVARGEGGHEYTLIMVDTKGKNVALKRAKDGLILNYPISTFIQRQVQLFTQEVKS